MKEFEKAFKEIFFFAHEYGHKKFLEQNPNLEAPNKDTFPSYLKHCHEGFYKAQELIVEELLKVQQNKKTKKLEIKKEKKQRNSDNVRKLEIKLKTEEYKEQLLRHAADSIAWQIFQGQHHVVKRLFANEQQPTLLENNMQSLFDYIEYYKQETPSGFCLISDITSFIQTGDLVCFSENGLQIIELKTGAVNEKILDILGKDFDSGKAEFCKTAHEKGKDFVKQFNRVLNQKQTMSEISNILRNDIGFDPRLKKNIKVLDTGGPNDNYYESIVNLVDKVKASEKTYAIDIVEKCVYLGIYKGIGRAYGPYTLKMWMNHKTKTNYPVSNFIGMLNNPINEPITYKPFDKDETFDILFNRLSLYIGVNFDYLFELANQFGFEMKWLSKKALGKTQHQGLDCFKVNKKGITISDGKNSLILGDNFISRIIHDFILPSSMFLTYKTIFREIKPDQFFKTGKI